MKKLIFTTAIIFCILSAFAQSSGQSAYMENYIFSNSSFIFDGKIIKQTTYYDGDKALTSNIVEVTNIYRGAETLKPGTVEVVTEGGWSATGGKFKFWEGQKRINMNRMFMFFCAPAEAWNIIPSGAITDNNLSMKIVGVYDYYFQRLEHVNLKKLRNIEIKTANDFYNYLKQKENIVLPEKIKSYNDSINNIIPKIQLKDTVIIKTDTTGYYKPRVKCKKKDNSESVKKKSEYEQDYLQWLNSIGISELRLGSLGSFGQPQFVI